MARNNDAEKAKDYIDKVEEQLDDALEELGKRDEEIALLEEKAQIQEELIDNLNKTIAEYKSILSLVEKENELLKQTYQIC